MATESDVRNAFDAVWKAKRDFARAQHEQSLAEQALEIRRSEYERAREALNSADERLQRLAERAAGLDGLIPDSDDPVPRHDGYRAVRR